MIALPSPALLVLSGSRLLQAVAFTSYILAQALLVLYAAHRYAVLWRRWRQRGDRCPAPPAPREWPRVTVQLPIYNERRVVRRLIEAVMALDYPADRLEVQVLDDSTDETTAWARAAAAAHAARGVYIRVLHRAERVGFKAGALAAGLREARGEFIAVFDADFVPPPEFLRRLIPHFADPRVGMTQARWTHLNRDHSPLTTAQAVLLDAHFELEHETRMRAGLFFNFNGTAGVWRRACIDAAGGWSHDTLTEDLDLSYRAQLAGWRFVYDGSVEALAELPEEVEALKSQQRRWTKGAIQTARKLLPRLLASPVSPRVKLEAFVHLTNNAAYPLLLAGAVLLLPVLFAPVRAPAPWVWALQLSVLVLGTLPVTLFLTAGQRAVGRRGPIARDVLAALGLGIGLSANNARAVLEGCFGGRGQWERTPKRGGGSDERGALYPPGPGLRGRGELVVASYGAGLSTVAVLLGHWAALPFPLLLTAACGAVGLAALRPRPAGG